jgi:hypothetical protein
MPRLSSKLKNSLNCFVERPLKTKKQVIMLTTHQAKKFFGSLYSHTNTPDLSDFDSAAIRLVARVDQYAVPGNKALGLLMLNAVMSSEIPKDKKAGLAAATLMNIQAPAVERFLEAFPSATLTELIQSAKKAGYEVDVLESKVANSLPRTLVGKGQLQN